MRRRLTLSFDNGPTPDVTPRVLDELDERDITAWFCVVGGRIRAAGGSEMVQEIRHRGHQVVNHSMNHQIPLGDDPSPLHARREISDMQDLLETELGRGSRRWFRPFGRGGAFGPHVFSPAAVRLLTAGGFSVLLWNSVPHDWDDPDGWVDTALGHIAEREHTLMVLHDIPTGAMDHLGRFLDEVERRDVSVVTDPPPSCVPLIEGRPVVDLTPLTSALI